MHDILDIDQIRQRAQRSGLPFGQLVKDAGVDYSTFQRLSAGSRGGNLSSYRKLTHALIDHELALLRHLLALHGAASAEPAEQRENAA